MRQRAKIDDNQPEIVKALQQIGCSVQSLAACGKGVPDLLIGYRGHNILLEVKDGAKTASRKKLTPDQLIWHALWSGQVAVVSTVDEALKMVMYFAR
jgi:Holliday junction resolvase